MKATIAGVLGIALIVMALVGPIILVKPGDTRPSPAVWITLGIILAMFGLFSLLPD